MNDKKQKIEELSKTTLTGYVHSAIGDRTKRDDKISSSLEKQRKSFSNIRHKNISKMMDKNEKRSDGVQKALNKLKEDVPTNNVSGGKIAGTGIGPQGEPGVPKNRKRLTPFIAFMKRKK
jgi:hypothetical protein